jgi:hypothetical protein
MPKPADLPVMIPTVLPSLDCVDKGRGLLPGFSRLATDADPRRVMRA